MVSLAGLAFAVGMVVDNSIVVLENIYRHRQMGKPLFEAAHEGAREVWGAVLASTLTTIAVFLPVIFIQEEAGSSFGDIAVAISCAVALSLVVSITVIPSLSAQDPADGDADRRRRRTGTEGTSTTSGASPVAGPANGGSHRPSSTGSPAPPGAPRRRRGAHHVAALGLSWLLMMPKAEYLPIGNQNFVFGLMLPPPGYSLDEVAELQRQLIDDGSGPVGGGARQPRPRRSPAGRRDRHFFFVASSTARRSWGERGANGSRCGFASSSRSSSEANGQLPGHLRRLQPVEPVPERLRRGAQHRRRDSPVPSWST